MKRCVFCSADNDYSFNLDFIAVFKDYKIYSISYFSVGIIETIPYDIFIIGSRTKFFHRSAVDIRDADFPDQVVR